MRWALLGLALLAGCFHQRPSVGDLRHAAAAQHSCPLSDTHVIERTRRGYVVSVCGDRYFYSLTVDGDFYEWPRAETERDPTPVYVEPELTGEPGYSGGPVHVRGYYRSDGTYVRPHSRRRPRR